MKFRLFAFYIYSYFQVTCVDKSGPLENDSCTYSIPGNNLWPGFPMNTSPPCFPWRTFRDMAPNCMIRLSHTVRLVCGYVHASAKLLYWVEYGRALTFSRPFLESRIRVVRLRF